MGDYDAGGPGSSPARIHYDTERAIADPESLSLVFDDARVGETTTRSIPFLVRSCGSEAVTLEIVDGPTVTSGPPGARFDTP